MQRIISMQMIRDTDRGSSEFVTKRLCFSFMFSVAFLSLLGGFLLGRYATDRAILLKSAILHEKQQREEKNSIEIMNNITFSVHSINNLTRYIIQPESRTFDYKEFYERLSCINHTANISEYQTDLYFQFTLKSSRVLSIHLESISKCFYDIGAYLDGYLKTNKISDGHDD